MKQLNKFSFAAYLVGMAAGLQAQHKSFDYKRPIEGVNQLWHSITIPDDVYAKMNPDLSDLRIIGIKTDGDTVEAPFLLRYNKDQLISREVGVRVLNQSRRDDDYFFTIEVQKPATINQLVLGFQQSNFDWKIQLEGSQEGRQWFTLLEKYRVVGIKNNWTDFVYSQLNFPTSNYRFYRVMVKAKEKPVLESVRLSLEDRKEGALKNYPLLSLQIQHDRMAKESLLTFTLQHKVPVSMVKVYVRDTIDFFRPVRISVLADSIKTENGWHYNYETVYTGTLNSLQKNVCWLQHVLLQKGKIEISNADNQPLRIDSIQVQGYHTELIARFSEPANYMLYYGNREMGQPVYDISNFTDKIPDSLQNLVLAKEMFIGKKEDPTAPLFENKLWLWATMLILIGLMGWFTLAMLRKKKL